MQEQPQRADMLSLAAEIVAAYVANNMIVASDLPKLITDVHQSLLGLGAPPPAPVAPALVPAVPVRKSVTDDYIVCLEDGKQFKSLKRHLATHFNLTPEAYRAKWNLPANYPMVAPAYAAARSRLAKTMGLGNKRRKPIGGRKRTVA